MKKKTLPQRYADEVNKAGKQHNLRIAKIDKKYERLFTIEGRRIQKKYSKK